jgi:predicted GIY-YIG superfamily endonuclease
MRYGRAQRDAYNYTLRNNHKVVYHGVTNDPERRINEHTNGGKKFSSYTIGFPCSREEAFRRERDAIDTYRDNQGRRPRYNKT